MPLVAFLSVNYLRKQAKKLGSFDPFLKGDTSLPRKCVGWARLDGKATSSLPSSQIFPDPRRRTSKFLTRQIPGYPLPIHALLKMQMHLFELSELRLARFSGA